MYHKLGAWIVHGGEIPEVKSRVRKGCLLISSFKSILEVPTNYLIGLEKRSNKRYN